MSVRVDLDQPTGYSTDTTLSDRCRPVTKTVFYARVSTADQTLEHQRRQAELAGFKIDQEIADHGVSGISTKLAERPQGKRLFDILRPGDTLVVRWVDRLGRDYRDVSDSIRHFMREGVVVKTVVNAMVFDGATKDPIQQAVRDALIAFMAATAEAQAVAAKEAQKAGIEGAKSDPRSYRGRKPSYDRKAFDTVVAMLGTGAGASAIAKVTGLTRQAVLRIRDDRIGAERALAMWAL